MLKQANLLNGIANIFSHECDGIEYEMYLNGGVVVVVVETMAWVNYHDTLTHKSNENALPFAPFSMALHSFTYIFNVNTHLNFTSICTSIKVDIICVTSFEINGHTFLDGSFKLTAARSFEHSTRLT